MHNRWTAVMMFHQNPENFVGYSNEYHKWRNRKLLLYICTIKLVPPRKKNHGTLFHVIYTCMYLDWCYTTCSNFDPSKCDGHLSLFINDTFYKKPQLYFEGSKKQFTLGISAQHNLLNQSWCSS